MAIGEPLVIEAKQVQHRRLQVVDMHRLFNSLEAKLVGGPMHGAPLHTTTGHPDRETVMVVVAAGG